MDSLLCDEVWLSSPIKTPDSFRNKSDRFSIGDGDSFYATSDGDCDQDAVAIFLEKELSYMPKSGYIDRLQSQNLFLQRFRAIQWLFKSCNRLNLSCETVFNAANYLDRFISINECEWHHWMVELLSVACLSVASKFNETDVPSLDEIQMEDLNHSFQVVTIQKMELILLRTLDWRLGSTTPYSYAKMLTINTDSFKRDLQKDLSARISKLLVGAMLDHQMLQYRPSTVAISALWCSLEELAPHAHIMNITSRLNQDVQDNLAQCHSIMREKMFNPLYNTVACGCCLHYCNPSSPVTVLPTQRVEIYDNCVDLSFFKKLKSSRNCDQESRKKRKREVI